MSGVRSNLRRLRKASRRIFRLARGRSRPKRETPLPGMQWVRDRENRLPHWCTPIDQPTWLGVPDNSATRDSDVVVGFFDGESAWALPWWIMKNHHVANLTLNDAPIMITFCEACAGAAAFIPVLDGIRYNLHVDGIYDGVILLTDRETASLWSPFTGFALAGPLEGRHFERLPVVQCTWSEWKSKHSNTLVLSGADESREGHGAIFVAPDSPSPRGARQERTRRSHDNRLGLDTLVLGVALDGLARAYPLDLVHRAGGVVNDYLGDAPIVAIAFPGSWTAIAFERRIDDVVHEFEARSDGRVVDVATGTLWDDFGYAVEGPLMGQRLMFVASGLEKWRSWHAPHPGTEIWTPNQPTGIREGSHSR